MATEIFSKSEFEAALPTHKQTGVALWSSLGLVNGEFCYTIPVNEHVAIYVRSSVDTTGYAAQTGEDSIRLWLVDPKTGKSLGGKLDAFTKRTKNWRTTMLDKLRTLYQIAKFIRPCTCGGMVRVGRSQKDNEHKGFLFASCDKRDADGKFCKASPFTWVADAKNNLIK